MIVADTGPLIYLVLIERVELLAKLFGQVLIPYEVKEELEHERTPLEVRAWIADHPRWLTVQVPGPRVVSVPIVPQYLSLQAPQRPARLPRKMLLVDDQRCRLEAIKRGLPAIGTVSVLYRAASAGMLDFETDLSTLLRTNFHLSNSLRLHYLKLWRESQQGSSR